jgi:MFS superfamily sulfate permease-like transporter
MFKSIQSDFRSSIVTFLVALPLCLGIALASQVPLAAGLITGIIGGLVVATMSGSPLSISGPAAGLVAVAVSGIHELGSFHSFGVAIFLAGIMQIAFSFLKVGRLGNLFPSAVIQGLLAAMGLILILKQFPHAIGFDSTFMGSQSFEDEGGNTISTIAKAFGAVQWGCVLISVFSLIVVLSWDRLSKKINIPVIKSMPSELLAVIFGVIINHFFLEGTKLAIEPQHLVQLPYNGGLDHFFDTLSSPNWDVLSNPVTYKIAFTIAIIGSLKSLLSIAATDKMDVEKRVTSKSRELLSQGVGNAIAGLAGGLPMSVVIVRTSANINAGAKSKLSGILHGVWLLLAVIAIPQVLNYIPLATLAILLILLGYKLSNPALYMNMFNKGYDQFIPFIVTVVSILLTDLLRGITVGMIVGFYFVFKRNYHQSMVIVHDQKNYLIKFVKDISFFQRNHLLQMLKGIPEGSSVTIDGSIDVYVDADIIDILQDFIISSKTRNINVDIKKSSTALSPFFKK